MHEVDDANRTALWWAAAEGHLAVVRKLLQMGSRATAVQDEEENAPVHIAIRRGHAATALVLVRSDSISSDLIDATGRTPLSWAAGSGMPDVIQVLLGFGADVNSWDNGKRTSAYWAAINYQKTCLTALWAHSDYEKFDADGHTVLTRMAACLHQEVSGYSVYRMLSIIESCGSVDEPDRSGHAGLLDQYQDQLRENDSSLNQEWTSYISLSD